MIFIPLEYGETKQDANGYYYRERTQCPFGVRDLKNDECYSGNGKNRCKFFVRHDWDKHYGCIACSHEPIKTNIQLELF